MDDTFHKHWLIIGDSANSYTKPYDIIPLEATEEFQESEPIKITPGYTCCYANQLRNGNIKTDLKFPQKSHVTFQKIIDRRTKGLYNCGENLLAMHHGSWTLYNSQTLTEMAEGRWGNNESTYFCYDSGFILFDEVLLSFSPDGILLKKVYLSSGSDIMRHEVAMIGDFTISAGYLKASSFPDGLPGRIQPSGQLESFKMKDLEVPEEPDDILEPSESNLLAFVEEDPLIPVYLNDKIIQVLNNKIALISLELTIIKVIAGEFRPLAVSASEESIIYMTCLIDNKMVLVAFETPPIVLLFFLE